MTARCALGAVWLATALLGCGGQPPPSGGASVARGALTGVTVTTDQTSYVVGATVTVSYTGLPGNLDDWIGIAPLGAPDTTYLAYVLTNGQTSGTATFAAPAGGTYVARAFPHNTFTLLAESASFTTHTTTGVSLSTDKSGYAVGETVTVSYAGLPGNLDDWIGIAPTGSPNTTYLAYVLTNGQTSGTATFTAPAAGTYVARAFPNNTFTLLAESASFTTPATTGVSLSTDKGGYAVGDTVTVTYAGLPGNPMDWIGIAPAGSPNTTYLAYVLTNGQTSGTATFTAPAAGTYVARAFPNNTFTLLAESASFTTPATSGVSLSTGQASYPVGGTVTVSYAGLPGNLDDWIALAPAGSPNTTYLAYVLTNGQTSGTATFIAPAAGTYVARAFPNNTFTLLAESASFTTPLATGGVSITRDKAGYALGDLVTVSYAGLPGNLDDWIALAPADSPDTTYVAYVLTGGQKSGTATFPALTLGAYVARAFPNNTFQMLAESASFVIGAAVSTNLRSYAPGSTVTVRWSGLPGNALDWIAIAPAGAPNTTYLAYVLTNGQKSGTTTFTAPVAGTYVARAFPNNTFALWAESAAFTTGPVISTDKLSYAVHDTVTVSYGGLPGNPDDWIGIAPAGSPNTTYLAYVLTNGQTSGTATFLAPAAGRFVARAFPHNTFALLAETDSFTVTASGGSDSVLMHHKHLNRDGLYVQPSLTTAAAAGLRRDPAFNATFTGHLYGQPLYVDNGSAGPDLVIIATESDTVYAFDASSGAQVWTATLGTPVPLSHMPCGNIDPLGITGTPVIDLDSRTLFVTALVTPDGGATKRWKIFALSIDDGSVRFGWPVDVAAALAGQSMTFKADVQGQRSALTLVNGVLYVPFGGLAGDCGAYHGWVVAVPIDDPTTVRGWATGAVGGGIWAPGGASSDGTALYVTTGNTFSTTTWAGGEAILRFELTSPPLAAPPAYWAPVTWATLDLYDQDMGGTGPIVFDLPGSTPSHLVLALAKNAYGYLEDADNLGGVADALNSIQVSGSGIRGAEALYTTPSGTFVAFTSAGGALCTGGTTGGFQTLRIIPGSPPTIGGSWCAAPTGMGAPIVTTTDGQSNVILWLVGAEGNNLLQGYDGETGATVYYGTDVLSGSRRYSSPIAAKGRIFVAGDNLLAAFTP